MTRRFFFLPREEIDGNFYYSLQYYETEKAVVVVAAAEIAITCAVPVRKTAAPPRR